VRARQPDGKRGDDWSKDGVLKSVERSLKRLKTDAVDLVLLHSCSLDELKKGECIEGSRGQEAGQDALHRLQRRLARGECAVESGRFDALRDSVNIATRSASSSCCRSRRRSMGVIAKRPIANAAWRYDESPAATTRSTGAACRS
jgi:aryl-alcohol dehydrogenase-like predicted oxidoreductase